MFCIVKHRFMSDTLLGILKDLKMCIISSLSHKNSPPGKEINH